MSDVNNSPVTLPSGSFDAGALQKQLDKAAKGKADGFHDAVHKALDESNESPMKEHDPRHVPGFKFVAVENKDLGVTENIQVFDPKEAEKLETSGAIPEADTRNAQQARIAEAVEAADSPKEK